MGVAEWMEDRANAESDLYAKCKENESCQCAACVEYRADILKAREL